MNSTKDSNIFISYKRKRKQNTIGKFILHTIKIRLRKKLSYTPHPLSFFTSKTSKTIQFSIMARPIGLFSNPYYRR